MNKKGAELSMNVIIISVIALVVLVVLVVVFVNKMGGVVSQTDTCSNNGGRCVENARDCSGAYEQVRTGSNYICPGADPKDSRDNEICCVGLSTVA